MDTINKLPEIIKCIIFDHVSNTLNYDIEICSDKFIGNPIDLYKIFLREAKFYHINKLTKIKIPLQFIGLNYIENYMLPPQEILNKLQKIYYLYYGSPNFQINLLNIKILELAGKFTTIPNFVGLLELNCSGCHRLTEIPNIKGLLILNCSWCDNLAEIPCIKGLQDLNCTRCELTEIPHIEGLLKLNCIYNTKLTKIPNIKGLQDLNCSGCKNLTEIPHIVGLLNLNCSGCINLTKICHILGLKTLDISGCINLTQFPHGLLELNYVGCACENIHIYKFLEENQGIDD